ncbi:AAA family ATPase [Actinoplanes sp. NPDC023714]|uniref:AAA family ATPase n=1 Tax=Actinoplanes sp. NPDC023714 TaxID=3154322 RepID=UPI0033EDA498
MRRLLIVTRGIPAAGKTTRALQWVAEDPEHRARVGTDEIAAMLHPQIVAGDDDGYTMHYARREQLVVQSAIEALLRNGIDVVCDDTFLLPDYLDAARELAHRCGADLIVWDMTDIDVDECIARDRQRRKIGHRAVGEATIRMKHQLLSQHQPLAAAGARGQD